VHLLVVPGLAGLAVGLAGAVLLLPGIPLVTAGVTGAVVMPGRPLALVGRRRSHRSGPGSRGGGGAPARGGGDAGAAAGGIGVNRGLGVSCRGLVHIYRLEGYDVVALAGVDLDIAPGESVALVGPSGSGKSTLLSVLAGLVPPAAGRVSVGDRDITRASEAELARMRGREVGVVLQGPGRNFLPYLSAEHNVRFAQRAVRDADAPTPREILSLVGLTARITLRRRPSDLTPGERQRLALAVALANWPGLLLADEPTSQLDSVSRDEVLEALESVRRADTTVVVVTHDPDVGARLGPQRHHPRRPGSVPRAAGARTSRSSAGMVRSTCRPRC
jgi:ABC-type lipoprotein export system ATPase subunit